MTHSPIILTTYVSFGHFQYCPVKIACTERETWNNRTQIDHGKGQRGGVKDFRRVDLVRPESKGLRCHLHQSEHIKGDWFPIDFDSNFNQQRQCIKRGSERNSAKDHTPTFALNVANPRSLADRRLEMSSNLELEESRDWVGFITRTSANKHSTR